MKIPDMTHLVNEKDKELIKAIVVTLDVLRGMDAERIQFLRDQVALFKGLFPLELLGGIQALELDFTLILAFIEQAKQYDRFDDAMKSLAWLTEKEEKDEGAQTS